MKPRFIYFIYTLMLLAFTGCTLVPLSLNGDSEKGLKQSLAGKWLSLDGSLQLNFDDTGNITMSSSMSSNRGSYSLTNSLMTIEVKQTYNGSEWADLSTTSKTGYLYHIFGNRNKLVLSPACNFKISGSFTPSSMDGKYISYYASSLKTSATSPDYTSSYYITTEIALDTVTLHYTTRQNYTISGLDYVSAPEFVLIDYDVKMDVFWNNGFFTINRQITNYHTYYGAPLEISLTNNIYADQPFFLNGSSSEGVSLVLQNGAFYSNQVFEKK